MTKLFIISNTVSFSLNCTNCFRFTVICTIHQPSTYLFEMFDSLLLLKKGGETVYFGNLGDHSSTMIKYLSSIPGTTRIADNANPATWMLEQIGAGTAARINSQVMCEDILHCINVVIAIVLTVYMRVTIMRCYCVIEFGLWKRLTSVAVSML